MDNVTHTLAGVTLGNAFFRKRVGPEAVPILAWASNLTDIDAVVMLSGKRSAVLLRRTFGHSLILAPLWIVILAAILRRFYPRVGWAPMIGLCALGVAGHLFMDLLNSFGVVLLWPLSAWRPELASVFIIDLTFAGLLAAPLVLSRIPSLKESKIKMSQISAAAVAVYLLFCGLNRLWAKDALERAAHPEAGTFHYVFPEPFGPHRWHGVVLEGKVYHQYLIHSLTGQVERRDDIPTDFGDLQVEQARSSDLGRRLDAFFKAPVWRREQTDPSIVSASDLRFRPALIKDRKSFEYRFRTAGDGSVQNLQ